VNVRLNGELSGGLSEEKEEQLLQLAAGLFFQVNDEPAQTEKYSPQEVGMPWFCRP